MQTIGRYHIETQIGAGGYGNVYRARDPLINRYVAIKLLRELGPEPELASARFVREARAVGRLSHFNVVTIYEVGEHEGRPFIVMEYLEGQDLGAVLHEHHRLPPAVAASVAGQAAGALDYAHQHGVIHRDVKPRNIYMLPGGVVKLLDFGIAKLRDAELHTRSSQFEGTAGYMSPEQVDGQELDGRSDMFSLGAVLYECLSGRRAFPGSSLAKVVHEVAHTEPPPLDELKGGEWEWLMPLVAKCLEKDRERRFASCAELSETLLAELAQRPHERVRFEVVPRNPKLRSLLLEAQEVSSGSALDPSRTGNEFTTVFLRDTHKLFATRRWVYGVAALGLVAVIALAGRLAYVRGRTGSADPGRPGDGLVMGPRVETAPAPAGGAGSPALAGPELLAAQAVAEAEGLLSRGAAEPEAAARFREALRLVPDHSTARAGLERLQAALVARGDEARGRGRYADALAAYDQALEATAGVLATDELDRLIGAARDDQAFVEACKKDRRALQGYLRTWPAGRHAGQARKLVEQPRLKLFELSGTDRGWQAALRLTQHQDQPALRVRVEHEHGFGPFASGCEGTLYVTPARLVFESDQKASDSFDLPIAALAKLGRGAKDGPVLDIASGKRDYHIHVLFESQEAGRKKKWGYKLQGTTPVYDLLALAVDDFEAAARHFDKTWSAQACAVNARSSR